MPKNTLLECPCPDCEALFERALDLQSHILLNHGDCYFAVGEAWGNRGSSADECPGENDDRHMHWSDTEDEDEDDSEEDEDKNNQGCNSGSSQ